MRKLLTLLFAIPFLCPAQDTTQHIVPGRKNAPGQLHKPYLILISADGFRYDLADHYGARNLIRLRESGVTAAYMQPVFPSLTFPNHYSIVTGDYPAHHGIVDNTFYDPARDQVYSMGKRKIVEDSSWYGGTPLWVLAEKQGMLTASYYWVGAESAIQGIRPTYYYKWNTLIPMNRRIEGVRDWLMLPEEIRPHLITFYISDVDHEEHEHGVYSAETEKAVHKVDDAIGKLVKTLDSLHLPINYIFVSDHGMTDIDTLHTLSLPKNLDTSRFVILNSLSLVHLYARDTSYIMPAYRILKGAAGDYDVYLSTSTPARWHYNKRTDRNNRIGDIILVAHPPKVFNLRGGHINRATHGFDPVFKDMRASFYAWGPAFRKKFKTGGFENIHVYPLAAQILTLKITGTEDGKRDILRPVLK